MLEIVLVVACVLMLVAAWLLVLRAASLCVSHFSRFLDECFAAFVEFWHEGRVFRQSAGYRMHVFWPPPLEAPVRMVSPPVASRAGWPSYLVETRARYRTNLFDDLS